MNDAARGINPEPPDPEGPDSPDTEFLAECANLLAERRTTLRRELDVAEAQLASVRDARVDTIADDEHDPDGPTLSEEWSRAEGLRAEIGAELRNLQLAEARLEAGAFGACERCGTRIPIARLRIRPAATLCVPCAEVRGL